MVYAARLAMYFLGKKTILENKSSPFSITVAFKSKDYDDRWSIHTVKINPLLSFKLRSFCLNITGPARQIYNV